MRVTFVLPEVNLGGGIRVVVSHAQRLARRGHRVVVVAGPNDRRSLTRRVKDVLRRRAPFRLPRASHFEGSSVDLRIVEHAPLVDADVPDADVVVATWWETAEWVAGLSPRKGTKCYFIQGDDAETPGQPYDRVRATWRLPMHKIAVAPWLVELIRDDSGDDASLVLNGIDAAQFTAPARGKQRRPTVGFVYQPLKLKGCDVILRALEIARRRVADLDVRAFGAQPSDPACPLPSWVRFTLRPPQARIPSMYASCDAWLWGSRVEGFGLPLLEAMACRTPVVATPAGAAPSLLAGGGGRLVPSEDPAAMADGLVEILRADDAQWRLLSDKALATATAHTADRAAERFEFALERAIAPLGLGRPVQAPPAERAANHPPWWPRWSVPGGHAR